MRTFVLDNLKQPLMPCSNARARRLLRRGKAAVYRRFPFTIILKEETTNVTQPVSLNIDPGSKITGIALNLTGKNNLKTIFAMHIEHRSFTIKSALESRRAIRRSRRNRNTRYRKPRFLNRKKPRGWLPPSVKSRVDNIDTWAKRLKAFAPISSANIETNRFDTQLMENAKVKGVEYQQGTLFDWEMREYLLYRHKHTCAYCSGLSKDSVLEKEHVMPKALGGSNRLSNLVIACRTCNENKNSFHPNQWIEECQKSSSKINQARVKNMRRIMTGFRPSLKDAAAMNATRYAVGRVIKDLISDTTFWSGGRTKKNRTGQNYIKDHWIDAACVGQQGAKVELEVSGCLIIKAKGHGSRQMCRVDRFGFPRTKAKQLRRVKGFKTGDQVIAKVPTGLKSGTHTGRVAVRTSGSFNISTLNGTIQGINAKHCRTLHQTDGYDYFIKQTIAKQKFKEEKQAA